MFKKIISKYLLFTVLLGSFIGSVQARAIKELHKVILPGKKIIIFGEDHKGAVSNTVSGPDIAKLQHPALNRLFNDFMPIKNSTVFYLECNDSMRELLIDLQTEQAENPFNYPSFFDNYYLQYANGNTNVGTISLLKNFDPRNEIDETLIELAAKFDIFLEEYAQSNYDQVYFNKAKSEFLESEEYEIFLNEWSNWAKTIAERLVQVARAIKLMIPQNDIKHVRELALLRLVDAGVLKNLNERAKSKNQSIYELLFDCAESSKAGFFQMMHTEFSAESDINTISTLFNICNLLADLKLLEEVLNDPHQMILVNCGYEHSEFLMGKFFQNASMVTTTNMLDLTKEEYLNNPQYCYQAMRQFIFG